MKKVNEVFEDISLISMELIYLIWGLFLAVYLPIMSILRGRDVICSTLKFPVSIYAVIVGLLYLISALFIVRRRPVGFKVAIIANILGIPFLVPIVIGVISFVLFNRPEVKAQFKK